MKYKIVWNDLARNVFVDLIEFLESVAGKKVSQKYLLAISERIESLQKFPRLGQVETYLKERIAKKEFRYLVYKNYKIIYFIDEEKKTIAIADFFDCRQNPEKMLKNQ